VLSQCLLQGGVETYDALFLLLIFCKRALKLVALLRKEICNLRHLMQLRHPVTISLFCMQCVIILVSVLHTFLYKLTTPCNTLQHTATNCNTLQHTATHCNTLQHTAAHCCILQYTATHTASHCNTLQRTATHCSTLQHTAAHCSPMHTLQITATYCNTLQHTATLCNTLQCTAIHCNTLQHTAQREHVLTTQRATKRSIQSDYIAEFWEVCYLQHTATHCNTLQHTATHCNSLQHTATHCNTLQHTATHCNTLQHPATHCNTLQHTFEKSATCNTLQRTATHCSTLQHTAAHCNTLQNTATHCNTLLRSLLPAHAGSSTLISTWDMTHFNLRHDSFQLSALRTMLYKLTTLWTFGLFTTWDMTLFNSARDETHSDYTADFTEVVLLKWAAHAGNCSHFNTRHDSFQHETWLLSTQRATKHTLNTPLAFEKSSTYDALSL